MSVEQDASFESLLDQLRRARGFDFGAYKRASLMRRVTKRMQSLKINAFPDYEDYLEVHPEEFTPLFNTILINVTAFFRDPPAWQYLSAEIVPRLLRDKEPGEPIRVWSAGCASGEEAYTLAMVLGEAMGPEAFRQRVKIYATDIDEEALTQARQAAYRAQQLENVPLDLRAKYFETVAGRHLFRADMRRMVIFGSHNLLQDAPISRLDLLVCRNTLMYFNAEAQDRILARFHFALNDAAYLFLGRAEMLLTRANLFTPLDIRHRVFAQVPKVGLRERTAGLTQAGDNDTAEQLARSVQLREAAFDTSPLAHLVVDREGVLTWVSNEARVAFGLGRRDVGRPFQDLEISYRPLELRSLIDQSQAQHRTIVQPDVQHVLPSGDARVSDVYIAPLRDAAGTALGVGITFVDISRLHRLRSESQNARQELQTAYEELQSTNEELETTNEELQSTVEELQTTTEELQSTNEEMETMNEELQSTNEELQAVNDELHQRTEELDLSNEFLESILASVRAAVVVVDRSFVVRLWNVRATDMWGLRASEAQGQALLDLDIGLPLNQLIQPLRATMAGKSETQELVLDATNRRGRPVRCHVSWTPRVGRSGERLGLVLLVEELEAR